MIPNSVIQKIKETSMNEIRDIVLEYLLEHVFLKSVGVAKIMLDYKYNINNHAYGYNECVLNWTLKISKILREFFNNGFLEVYRKSRRHTLYKKIKEPKKEEEKQWNMMMRKEK